jgi:ABC-type bacteriocin/lantibiotic exporter with double-glycine peptidase domain
MGVVAIGVLGTLTVFGIGSRTPGDRVNSVLRILSLENMTFQQQAAILGIFAAIIFIARTVFSIILTRRVLYFLGNRAASISAGATRKLLAQPLPLIQKRSPQEIAYLLGPGINAIMLGVLGLSANIISDVVLLIILVSGLLLVNPVIALISALSFGFVGILLYRATRVRARNNGLINSRLMIETSEKTTEAIDNYREIFVRSRLAYYADEIFNLRVKLSSTIAEQQLLPNLSKYLIEASVILIGLVVSGVQFAISDASHAIAGLSIFLAASSRLAPAVMRIQQNAIQLKGNLGIATPAMSLVEELRNAPSLVGDSAEPDFQYEGFNPIISLDKVTYSYPNSTTPVLNEITLEIKPGHVTAIVGPSGAGKSTLLDLILGIVSPTAGVVRISEHEPKDAITKWPGAISYVPQNVNLTGGSITDNITRGFRENFFTQNQIQDAINFAQLVNIQNSQTRDFNDDLGFSGARLSGGQRQRVGIAHAIVTRPRLLALDEATSALDGETEDSIKNALQQIRGEVSILIVAHRLSTVRNADQVIYLRDGRIEAVGTFEEVRNAVPDFDKQAQLMGL